MRTRIILGACLSAIFGCTSTRAPANPAPARVAAPSQEFAGVYTSTPDEDYFVPCGIDDVGDTWSLDFRDNEVEAPFLKKVTGIRGYPPLTHFIRVRGRLGPPRSYNLGFQTRAFAVDSVLEVKETLEPCARFGIAAAWRPMPPTFRNAKSIALSTDRRFAALTDIDGRISVWSTETGRLARQLGSVAKGNVNAATYGPMTFSDDGTLLAVGGVDGIARVWRLRDGKRIFSLALKDSAAIAEEKAALPPPTGWTPPAPSNSYRPVQHLVFNRRGTMLAATNLFSSIVWSMKTGKKLAEFSRGNDFHSKLLFVGDESLLMTADSGRMVLRSYLDATPVTRAGTRARATEHVVMSANGRWLAVHGWGDSVFLWSVADGKPGPVLPVPPFSTGAITFSPDGNTVATSGGSSGLYLWDTRTGAPIKSFHNFPNALFYVWFSTDGKSIITFSAFDDRLRIVYVDSSARAAAAARGSLQDDSLTAQLPLGPKPSSAPRTVGGLVTGADNRAIADATVEILNGDAPDSVLARATTSSGGYFSFPGIRFRHVLIRVRKSGFETGVKYIHLNRWSDEGPWSIELTPDARRAESTGD